MSKNEEPVYINMLTETGSISSSRHLFDELVGVDSSDMRAEEIDYYLPRVHELRSSQLDEIQFVKTHDALTKNQDGNWLIPLSATYKVIYLIRNPLDVCVSYAYHSGHDKFDITIQHMSSANLTLAKSKKKVNLQIHQYMGSWTDHVLSWTENMLDEKIHVVRYEDMKKDSVETFYKIVKFSGLDYTKEEVAEALDKSKIEKLQKQEDEYGFNEKTHRAKRFFRKGVVGSWRDDLSEDQAQRIIDQHRPLMEKYNYISPDGQLLV